MTGQDSPGLVWYINGYMAPEIYVKRGNKYTFSVYGGNDPNRPQFYHPLYITDDLRGDYEHLSPQERKKVRVYAGVDFSRRSRPIPTAVGKLCWWKNDSLDLRHADSFPTFSKFRNTLQLVCEEGDPAILVWVPNSTTPDVVYYQSFCQANMGWRINVVDSIPSNACQLNCNILFDNLFTLFLLVLIKYAWMIQSYNRKLTSLASFQTFFIYWKMRFTYLYGSVSDAYKHSQNNFVCF